MIRAANSPWHGDRCYVDLMYPGVTEKFLEVTHEAYRQHLGDQFGKRVLGFFTDEPNIRPAGGLPWTEHLPAAFQKRWGYNLLDHLPSLLRPIGDWKRVRHNYFQVLSEQFIEHWSKPYSQWCEKHGISWTGHYWDHDWPHCTGVPDNMAMYAWHQIPAIDCLMNQYREETHAQFGNARMVKELASVANQLGRDRRLCEVYGAGGWDLRFEDMKRIGDWLEVLGVNFLDQHLSYVTIRGARKADHPQSFSYHEPWWDSYHEIAEYFNRLTAAISHGEQRNEILVIEPTTTAWMYQDDTTQAKKLDEVGKSFFDLVMSLEERPGGIRPRVRGYHRPPWKGGRRGMGRDAAMVQGGAGAVSHRRIAARDGDAQRPDDAGTGVVPRSRRNGYLLRPATRDGRRAGFGRRREACEKPRLAASEGGTTGGKTRAAARP